MNGSLLFTVVVVFGGLFPYQTRGDVINPLGLGKPQFAIDRALSVKTEEQQGAWKELLIDNDYKFLQLSWKDILLRRYENSGNLGLENSSASRDCLRDVEETILGLRKKELFAVKMLDADAKISSGILEGNVMWPGAYDECRKVRAITNVSTFRGLYCLAEMMLPLPVPPVVGGYNLFLGICVPDSCSESDAAALVHEVFHDKLGLNSSAICDIPIPYTTGSIIALIICGILCLLLVVGTVLDYLVTYQTSEVSLPDKLKPNNGYGSLNYPQNNPQERTGLLAGSTTGSDDHIDKLGLKISERTPSTVEKFLVSFSIITNGKKLFNTHTAHGNLTAINGIRVLSMWWVIQGHTNGFSELFIDNMRTLPDVIGRFTFQAIINASFSVDTFFFLSGLLVAYLTLNLMRERGGRINWIMFIIHRFWRLTPVLAFCVMFFSTLILHITEGPFSKIVEQMPSVTLCDQYWWTNILYINNFYPSYGDMNQCMVWTWYLANDMQFYLISPLLLVPLYRWRRVGIAMVIFLIFVCLLASSVIARWFGMKAPRDAPTEHLGDLYAKHDIIYNKPFTRIAPYLVGMLVGFVLSSTRCRIRLNKYFVGLGWALAVLINLSVLYGLYGLYHGQVMSLGAHALYIGTSRFGWSLGLAWVAFACAIGYGGPVKQILSWKIWAPLGRLTYCAYLVHPMVIFTIYINERNRLHYTDMGLSFTYVGMLTISYAVAFLVSMLVEAPMMGLEKIFFKKM